MLISYYFTLLTHCTIYIGLLAKEYIKEGTEVVIKHFPMGKKNRVEKAKEAYEFIEEK